MVMLRGLLAMAFALVGVHASRDLFRGASE